jgi:sulfur transfer protein SufE
MFEVASGWLGISSTEWLGFSMNHCFTSASTAIDELVTTFQGLSSWEDRYCRLIELGKELPCLAATAHEEALCFRGCQSCVWLQTFLRTESAQTSPGGPRLHFVADSDSKINRGLIAILQRVYSGQPTDFFLQHDLNRLFVQLDLEQHLSSGRRNGLSDMERHLKEVARSAAYASV